jgi:hypothetical protein
LRTEASSLLVPSTPARYRRPRGAPGIRRQTIVTVRNHAKERLDAGELALGVGLRQARTVDIARIMKTAGYDFLFIDMEHNTMKSPGLPRLSGCRVAGMLHPPAFEIILRPCVGAPLAFSPGAGDWAAMRATSLKYRKEVLKFCQHGVSVSWLPTQKQVQAAAAERQDPGPHQDGEPAVFAT